MKIYLISGEASGDLHASNLIHSLKRMDNDITFKAWGGDKIKATGVELVKHYKDLAFMGFVEVVKNLSTILNNLKFAKKDILSFSPDVLVLIDYPGFNLRIAKWAKSKGIKVVYYISPQIWAWNTKRVHKIKRVVDEMIVILPFEQEFYRRHGLAVKYVGHPLIEVKKSFEFDPRIREKYKLANKPILLLMPGSRKQEIKHMLPIMIEASKKIMTHQVVIAGIGAISDLYYKKFTKGSDVTIIKDENHSLLTISDIGWIGSGTATLEAALFELPQVVCYKGNSWSYRIAKRLIKVPYISLVNLIANKELVSELIQNDFTVDNLIHESDLLTKRRKELLEDYKALVCSKLGEGNSSEKAADIIFNL